MLHEFLESNREELVRRCREKVATRKAPRATDKELEYGVPLFLLQLGDILREEIVPAHPVTATGHDVAKDSAGIAGGATSHGDELLRHGFTIDQVVHDYGDLCQSVTELAIEQNAQITNDEFRTLNRCLDNAIASAVSQFTAAQKSVLADASHDTLNERLGLLAHEFQTLLNTAMITFDVIKRGNVGIAGSTGTLLDRSLRGLHDLCTRTLVDVRLNAGAGPHSEQIRVSELINETRISASLEAQSRGIELVVSDVGSELTVNADRHIVVGVLANLLQNAFKFTISHGAVFLRAYASSDRILIEVEDECGGLPGGDTEELFRPFGQYGPDGSGIGLGLSISRRGVEATGGKLLVRSVPGQGCIFTLDFPHPDKN
jgi:signal transduction histidine kinase